MRALVQRVNQAEVWSGGKCVGRIGRGLLVYVGIGTDDLDEYVEPLARKIANLRIFDDGEGKLNLSVRDARGGVLAVSNFTLLGDTRKGRRPSFADAAGADLAQPIYERFLAALAANGCRVECGAFGEHMEIQSQADGPVNLVVEYPSPA